ncbi:GGDEF domain-containing protein [Acidisoma cladoniae]|uniref:GGDEF domain-containing protein n=1 Tax=Acidisoma cladoniae TaxID=3040935 RepID=UPI00254F3408|nr:GGDEF domain-containing protein [Acidisoma sp. PAMC 29798]
MDSIQAEPSGGAGLEALTRFARRAAGADFALAFQAGADGLAVPLASDPGPLPRAFSLGRTRFESLDWSGGPKAAAPLALPSSVLLAIDRPVQQALFIPTPFADAPRSGVLLLWVANRAWRCECPFRDDMEGSVILLQSAFGQMLAGQQDRVRRTLTNDRFHDLFETVPTGIVFMDRNASHALVNERAAVLLDMAAGEVEAAEVGARMRAMREGCRNRDALEILYADLQTTLDYASTAIWVSEASHIEVDTHPVLGHGRNGRIWLFHDVTARERLDDELRRRADTDALTGLANRRRFFEVSTAALQKATLAYGAGSGMSILLLDIDHFKAINDRHGHPAGDAVLHDFALRCQSVLRQRDVMARMGGEEFAVLLPGTGAEEARGIAERLCSAVGGAAFEADDAAISVTVSIGATTRIDDDHSLDPLLKRADLALYEAKMSGRNRVGFKVTLADQTTS